MGGAIPMWGRLINHSLTVVALIGATTLIGAATVRERFARVEKGVAWLT